MDIKEELRRQTEEDKKGLVRMESCSARDCTGLIASKAIDEYQAECYDEIYSYNPAHYYDARKMKKRGK